MKAVYNVAKYTLLENARSKSFSLSVVFIALVFVSAFIFAKLSEVVEIRAIQDIGMGAVQFFSFLTALFFAVKVAFVEGQNKTIYLPLTRPVKRSEYIFGRYLGIILSAALEIAAMGMLLTILLYLKQAEFDGFYFLSYFFIFLKIMMITAVTILISLASTSQASAFIFSFLVWITGHSLGEVEFLLDEMSPAMVTMVRIFKWIFPNYTLLNLADYTAGRFMAAAGYLPAVLYAVFYVFAVMWLAAAVFEKKEF
ncbi:MAG: hypothetical protein CVU78_04650 [Elusimicrobia bacterium HGW-Elusimicrobia-2]|nr:MAG: hypothetical protein CVU78_04650 [Elusimicrobia bacterium HGW-Elusimicrobia-2]